jgi:hypothetical protein
MKRHRTSSALLVFLASTLSFRVLAAPAADAEPTWCPPDGPQIERFLPTRLAEGQHPFFKPGWALISMRVRPGRVPVDDVRVLSESGSDALARTWLPLVRQWTGCAANERETEYQVRFTFGIEGIPTFPDKEAFSIRAFNEPRGAPVLPRGDWGAGVCPVKATIVLNQPAARNTVVSAESATPVAVADWLGGLVPDLEYMRPNPKGNRVEFDCRVMDGQVRFTHQ